MSETPADFRDTLAELVETTYPKPDDHPSEERWIAYQRGALPAEEMERLEEHLVRCRDCFDLVQLAAALVGAPEETGETETGGESEELASAALWRLLRPQLGREGRAPRPAWRFRLPETLAASFLVGLLGLTAWNLELRRDLQSARAPRPNAPIYDVFTGERAVSEGVRTDEKIVPAGPGPWMLVVHPDPDSELPLYRLAVLDASGRPLWSFPDLRRSDDRALHLVFSEPLPPGRYRLELFDGSPGASGKVLEQYLLRVVATPGGG